MKQTLLFLFLLLTGITLQAQDSDKRPADAAPFFVDADVGFMLVPDYTIGTFTHASVGAGYRFHPYHALGLEYRGAKSDDFYYDEASSGIGALYRFTWKGIFVKASYGFIFSSKKKDFESPIKYNSTGGGHYQNVTLGYHFRNGILLGLSVAGFFNRDFDREKFILEPEFDDGGLFPFFDVTKAPAEAGVFVPDGTQRSSFGAITLTAGYAFPGRGKR